MAGTIGEKNNSLVTISTFFFIDEFNKVRLHFWAELRMGGPASRPGSRGHAVIWNGKTLLKPMVKKHPRLVQKFYLLEQRWARMQDFNS